MRTSILIVLLVSVFNIAKADFTPPVQALARVILLNGDTIEGFIQLKPWSSMESYYNGFYIEKNGNYEKLSLFDDDFEKIEIDSIRLNQNQSIKYLEKVSFLLAEDFKDGLLSEENQVFFSTLELRDSISVFEELPLTLYVEFMYGIKFSLEDIKSFEIIKNPSNEWLKHIEDARSVLRARIEKCMKEPDVECEIQFGLVGDYQEPRFYHEMLDK